MKDSRKLQQRQGKTRSLDSLDLNSNPSVEDNRTPHKEKLGAVSAKEIKAIMDDAVVGQDNAKELISVLISMHLGWDYGKSPNQTPPNAVLVGPTGSGKTYSIDIASRGLKIPFIIVDATTLSPTGNENGRNVYHLGRDIEREAAGFDKCIVFIDEFDKLNQIPDDRNQYWQRHIQKGLLKIIEGRSPMSVKPLFFVGGAFQDIEKVERQRSPEVSRMMRDAPRGTIISEDLINYGFMPELIARIPAVIQFDRLSENQLRDIIENSNSSPLYIWKSHFASVGRSVTFSEDFIDEVVNRAFSLNLGARGLQQIIFPALSRVAYSVETDLRQDVTIDSSILKYKGLV